MSLEFSTVTLGDIVSLVIDYRGKTPKKLGSDWSEKGICALSAKNIKTGNIIREDTIRYVDEELYKKWMKDEIKRNDIIITSEAPFGEVFFWNSDEKIVLSQRLFGVRCNPEIVDPKFIYFYMTSDEFQWELQSRATGTTVKGLRQPELLKCEIKLPNFTIQKKISYLLSNIEDKIDCLKELNKNLDNLLMSIFNSWFINFEVYDKSNGMKFDETFGDVPRLWSVEMLEDYVDFVTGVEPGSKNYHEKPEINDIPFIRVGDLGSRINTVFIDKLLSKNKILSPDDITLSLDATVGIVKMGLNGAYSTGMRKLLIKNDDINKPFLYCLVKSKRIQRIIETFATGTTILHAGKSIKHMNFVLSDEQTMNQFGKIGNPILSIILANLKEINKLTKLRDTLLPKLMSGEIDVSKINCDLKIIIRKIYIKSSKLFLWRYLSENKNYIKNTKSNETLLKSRTIYKINKFLAKFNARYRYYRQ